MPHFFIQGFYGQEERRVTAARPEYCSICTRWFVFLYVMTLLLLAERRACLQRAKCSSVVRQPKTQRALWSHFLCYCNTRVTEPGVVYYMCDTLWLAGPTRPAVSSHLSRDGKITTMACSLLLACSTFSSSATNPRVGSFFFNLTSCFVMFKCIIN